MPQLKPPRSPAENPRSPAGTSPAPELGENPDALAREQGIQRLAGLDEVGRGPWAGPVVACAVMLRIDRLATRIDDSKRLTALQRERACELILRHADVGIGIVPADEIDHRNILQATVMAMQQAVSDLQHPPELVLVDGAVAPTLPHPCWPILGGDRKSYVIGCASIVAKVVRDRLMRFYHGLLPDYGFDSHKGYGTELHQRALAAFGPSALHRLSFAPVRVSQSPADRQETLPDAGMDADSHND